MNIEVDILLTIYSLLALYFANCVGMNRALKNLLAIILGMLIGSLWL